MFLSTGGTNISVPINSGLMALDDSKVFLQAHLGNNMAATSFVSGNANVVADTRGTGNWKFYVAGGNSIASITGASNSTEWTSGSLLSYTLPLTVPPTDMSFGFTFNTNSVSGNTLYSSNGNYTATIVNASILSDYSPGPGIGYVKLTKVSDTVNSRVVLPPITVTNSGFTVAMWFRSTAATVLNGRLFDVYANSSAFIKIIISTSPEGIVFQIPTISQNIYTGTVRDDIWRHFVCTVDAEGAGTQNDPKCTVKCYIDGTLQTTTTLSSYPTKQLHNNVRISSNPIVDGRAIEAIDGGVDDFRFYHRSITAEEVSLIYSQSSIYYPFETADINPGNPLQVGEFSTGSYVYNGTLVGGATIAVDAGSRVAGKGYLKATSTAHKMSLPPVSTGANGLTFALWFKMPTNRQNVSLFDFNDGGDANNQICVQTAYTNETTGEGPRFYTIVGGSGAGDIYVGPFSEWTHFVFVLTPPGNFTTYVNGSLHKAITGYNYPISKTRVNHNVLDWKGSTQVNNAGVDDFRFYQRAITVAEITVLYSGPPPPSIKDSITGATWIPIPATPLNSSETNYTIKNNEIALTPGTNSTYAVWTATKSTNLKIDVSFADYHTRSAGVGFQMFKIKSDNTFDSVLFPRTVTSTALTDANSSNSSNYLPVPTVSTTVTAGDKIYLRVDANGNTTAASSVLATTIFTDAVSIATNPVENRALQANLAANLNSGNNNTVLDTVGNSNWQFYVAPSTSVAAISSASNSTEWTGGSLLSYDPGPIVLGYSFDTTTQTGSTVKNTTTNAYDLTLYNGATIATASPAPNSTENAGYLSINVTSGQYAQSSATLSLSQPFSISFWFKRSGTGPNVTATMFEMGDSNLNAIRLSDNNVAASHSNGSQTETGAVYSVYYGDANWHHLVFVFNGGVLYPYGDGGARSTMGGQNYNVTSNFTYFSFGKSYIFPNPTSGTTCIMNIDKFQIFNTALSGTEITALYNGTYVPPIPTLKHVASGVTWMSKPAFAVNSSETSYTVKSNEIAIAPGANSTYAVWTAPKTTNIKVDVSFADYHTRSSAGVGFQMFKINADNTFGSVIFPRTVTSVALTNANPNNYLSVPSRSVSVTTGDKIYLRIDANGNPTSASSVLSTNIYVDPNPDLKQPNLLQAHLGNNMAATTFVSGNSNVVADTRGTGNWKFYAANSNSIASITELSNSTEWTAGSLLSYSAADYSVFYPFNTNTVSGSTVLNMANNTYDLTLYGGASIINTTPFPATQPPATGSGYLNMNLVVTPAQYAQPTQPYSFNPLGSTFSFWVRWTSNVEAAPAFSYGTGTNFFVVTVSNFGAITWSIRNGASQSSGFIAFQHGGFPFNYAHITLATGTGAVYTNGVLHAYNGATMPTYGASIQPTWFYFGNYDPAISNIPGITRDFSTKAGTIGIDNFVVYNKTLTATEVMTLYAKPDLYYPMDVADINPGNATQFGEYSTGTYVYNGNLFDGATIAVDSGSRIAEQGYLKLDAAYSQYATLSSFTTGANGLTFACWFRTNSTGGARIFEFSQNNSDYLILAIQDGKYNISVYDGGGGMDYPGSGAGMYDDNIWRHVVFTFHPTNGWKVYTNGVLDYTKSDGNYPPVVTRNVNYIGKGSWNDPFLNGGVDDFRIYHRVITDAEISYLYSGPSPVTLKDDATGVAWMPSPATPIDASETSYTIKNNEVALKPGTNSTFAVWTATKFTNLKIDVSFADYHTRSSAGVGFQMFKIKSDNTFDSILFPRTVTSTALTNAAPNNYLPVPSVSTSVSAGDKIYLRVDANGNTTAASSVLATTIFTDAISVAPNPVENRSLQAHLGNNLNSTTFVSGNANVVLDTLGTSNWQFYVAPSTSVAAITSSSASSEWTGGSLLSYFEDYYVLYYNFDTTLVSGSNVYNTVSKSYDATLVNATVVTTSPSPSVFGTDRGYLVCTAANYLQINGRYTSGLTGTSIATWINVNGAGGDIFKSSDGTQSSIRLFVSGGTSIALTVSNNAGDGYYSSTLYTNAAVNNGSWHHVVLILTPVFALSTTFTNSSGNSGLAGGVARWQLFFDGVSVFDNTWGNINAKYPDYIVRGTNFIGPITALIDDFRVYDVALTTAQATALYNGPPPTPTLKHVASGATWMSKPAIAVDSTETNYTIKSNEVALTPGTNSTYAVWTAPKSTNIRVDVSFADYHSRNVGVGFQMFKINADNTFGSVIYPRTVTSTALTNANPNNYLSVPSRTISVATGDKLYYRIDANGNTTAASSVLATTIYVDPNEDLKQYNVLQANLASNLNSATIVSGNANVVNDTRGTGNWKFYVAGGNSIASITGASNSTEWTGGSLLSTNDTFTGTLLNGATYVADAGSRVSGKNYLKLPNSSGVAKCASILPFTPTTNGISFSFWIKHTEIVGTYGAFFFIFRDPGNANMTYIGGSLSPGYLAVSNNSGGVVNTGIPFSSVANGNWNHIAWTMTYSASNTSTWKIYLNGVVSGTTLTNRSYMNLVTRTYHTIGCVEDANIAYAINGGVDNFRIYHKVLSDAEVLADVADVNNLPTQLSDSMSQSPVWKLKPAIAVDDTETNYTVKSNEIALKPGTNSTFAVWTATKSTNLKIDVSFADYHTRSAGVGFQMFKIKSDNTFDSVLFPRTVTSTALTNAAPTNYLSVPSVTTTVIPGDKIYLRVDANGNTTAASSVLATNIYTDAVSAATNPAETRVLQANLASNLNVTTPVSGTSNTVLDTVGNGDWKFYVAGGNSIASISSASNSTEWTDGSLLSYNEIDYYMFYPFNTNGVSGSTLLNLATNSYGATLYGGASIVNTVPSPATQPPAIGSGYLNMDIGAGQYVQLNQSVSLNSSGSTISFWFRWSANVSNDGTPIFSYDDGTDYLIIYMWGNGTCVIYAKRNGITNGAYVFGTNDLAPFTMGDWVHLSILTGTGRTYVNGIVLPRDTINGFSSIQPTKMYFGNSSASASFLMDNRTFSTKSGTVGIDNFVIHNKTLSDEEVGALYSNSRIYYTFDSDSVTGNNVGNKSTGTYVNDATLVNSASIGTSNPSPAPTSGTGHLQLTSTNTIATNQYVQLSVVPNFIYQNNRTSFSVSFWARSNSTLGSSAKNNFFDFANSIAASENANYSFSMYLQSNNIRGKISYGASGVAADDYVMQTDSSILTDNVWRHYVWTVSSGYNIDSVVRWKLYINSVLVFTKSSGFNLGYPMDYYYTFGNVSYTNSFIGRDAGSWQTASFSGAIDEFRWYKSRVIGQAEVSVLYATQVSVGKFQNPSGGNPTWIAKPTFAVDSTETLYTIKSNEIAIAPGTNSTYAVWTAPKTTNIRVDVSFADYHSRSSAGVGFQMFKINNDNTFGSTIFPRTVTSTALTNAAPNNYLNVPSVSLSVTAGDKVYYRVDANGNTTSASSVISTNIYSYSGKWN